MAMWVKASYNSDLKVPVCGFVSKRCFIHPTAQIALMLMPNAPDSAAPAQHVILEKEFPAGSKVFL
jgi:hypothetical protein